MITCPKCQATLPDWAKTCQFCQTDVQTVVRPPTVMKQQKVYGYGPAPWVWVAYYIIASWWVLSAGFSIFRASVNKDGPDVITLIVSGITLLLGLGLLAKIEIARGIANFFSWVKIIFSALGVLASFGLMMLSPAFGVLLFIFSIFDIVSAGLLIYVIGETGQQ